MFAFLVPLLFAMYLGGLMDYPCTIPNCADHCLGNTTGTNCAMGEWSCLCFADIFLENFDQCASKWCTEKEFSGAFCSVAKQCSYYNAPMTVGRYSTAMTSSASLASILSAPTTAPGSDALVETTAMPTSISIANTHTVSTRVTTNMTSTLFANASTESETINVPALSGNKSAQSAHSLTEDMATLSGNASIPSRPPVLDGPPTYSVLSIPSNVTTSPTGTHAHTHSSTESTAPTLSKTPPKITETDTATASGLDITENPANAPPSAATTTGNSAGVVLGKSLYKAPLGALVAVGALMAGL